MSQIVMVTGTGRSYALGFNLVLRYLENGDHVVATVRKSSEDLTGPRLIVNGEDPDPIYGSRE